MTGHQAPRPEFDEIVDALLAEFIGSSVGILIKTGRDAAAVDAARLAYHYAGRALDYRNYLESCTDPRD
jgi:hypothetical protein